MNTQTESLVIWELAKLPSDLDKRLFPEPVLVKDTNPKWLQNLPGNLKTLSLPPDNTNMLQSHGWRSAKFCLGLRGVKSVGYTIPLSEPLVFNAVDPSSRDLGRAEILLHPEMLHGTIWSEKQKNNDDYEWGIKIISWPWRAKLPKHWRLLVTAYPLEWSNDWFCFSGCVDANYQISENGHNINSFWDWAEAIDLNFNYFNVETVIAVRKNSAPIPAGTCLFSMVPLYDPNYTPATFKGHPSF